ncbi:MAG: sigma-54 dependent transcriptional regulator [Melioribacteraceae bacterium]|nr:sigma-54 dependent transcriptional regulator [Melioribacteraceae bacterium]
MNLKKILAVDDDVTFLNSLEKVLISLGFIVEKENVSTNVLDRVKANGFDVVLLDIKMPGLNGIELLEQILSHNPILPVIIISGQSTINIAVEAMKLGAFDFIEKPIDKKRIEAVLKNAVNFRKLSKENLLLTEEIAANYEMIGKSNSMLRIFNKINITAKTDAKVLITGETGTGKELVARAIHMHSNRSNQPYIKVNCAAIPRDLLESELFGHKKGSFTGAFNDKMGKFKAANGGTLFLDEIGDLDFNMQAKILRILEEGEIEIIGENTPQNVDVRVIAATNKILSEEINAGNFRDDLFHRLNVVEIHIPPLRERKDDIKPLVHHFLKHFNSVYNKSIVGISDRAISILLNLDWQGNIRELRNLVEKLVIYSKKDFLEVNNVSELFEYNPTDINNNKLLELKVAKSNFEKEYIANALISNDGEILKTAKILGLDRSHLFKKMKSLGIDKADLK